MTAKGAGGGLLYLARLLSRLRCPPAAGASGGTAGVRAAGDRTAGFRSQAAQQGQPGAAAAGRAAGAAGSGGGSGQQHAFAHRWPWDREVPLKPAQIALLLMGSAALGSQAERCWDSLPWAQATVEGYFRSFLAHSQHAQPPETAQAAVAPPGSPFLSPYFISDAAAKAAPAVVNIMVHSAGAFPTGSSGSGFIVDGEEGTILTNAHVVADAITKHLHQPGAPCPKGITVTLQDGRIFEGQLVNYDTVSDLAVLKVESDQPLPAVKLGTSAGLRVGEWVVALGSPLHLQNSVTAGIVSCVDRKAVELGLAGARTDYIQTDAAINKGNSGGPLVNLRGEVVGISAMKAVAADGVSFAIPIDTATDVVRQLKTVGRVIRPYAGMKMLQLNPHNAAQLRRRDPNFPGVQGGILVPQVHPGSPADKAGLKAGDIIIGFAAEHKDVTTGGLVKALTQHVGKPMALRVARPAGEVVQLWITAQEASDGHHH